MNNLMKIKSYDIWIRLITFLLITTFLCQNICFADNNYAAKSYKIAARSRWEDYGMEEKYMDGFMYATRKLQRMVESFKGREVLGDEFNRTIIDKIREINSELDTLEYEFSIQVPIDNKVPILRFPKRTKQRKGVIYCPFLIFNFGRQVPKRQMVLFNMSPEGIEPDMLKHIGIKNDRDKEYLRVPGSEKVWAVKVDIPKEEVSRDEVRDKVSTTLAKIKNERELDDLIISERLISHFTVLFYLNMRYEDIARAQLKDPITMPAYITDEMIEKVINSLIDGELGTIKKGRELDLNREPHRIKAVEDAVRYINNYVAYLNREYGIKIDSIDKDDIKRRIIHVPQGIMTAKGVSSNFFRKIFVEDNPSFSNEDYLETIIHEILHDSFSKLHLYMDEAMTVFFTNKILEMAGVRRSTTVVPRHYVERKQLINLLVDRIGEEEIARLFFFEHGNGEMPKWEEVINIASFEKLDYQYGRKIMLQRDFDDFLNLIILRSSLGRVMEHLFNTEDSIPSKEESIRRRTGMIDQLIFDLSVPESEETEVRFPRIINEYGEHEFLEAQRNRRSDATWIYRNQYDSGLIPEIHRKYLEQAAHNYLEKAGADDRIIRLYGPGVDLSVLAQKVETYCRRHLPGRNDREIILDKLRSVEEYLNVVLPNIEALNHASIAVVIPEIVELEPMGFSHIDIPNRPSFTALTAVGGRYAYEGSQQLAEEGKTPYTIYMRLDDIMGFIPLGDQGMRAFTEKLSHEFRDSARKLRGEGVSHIDEEEEIVRFVDSIERQILDTRKAEMMNNSLYLSLSSAKKTLRKEGLTVKEYDNALIPIALNRHNMGLIEQFLMDSDISIDACIHISISLGMYYKWFPSIIRKSTVTALGSFFARQDLTGERRCYDVSNYFFEIANIRPDLRDYVVDMFGKVLTCETTSNDSIRQIHSSLLGIRQMEPSMITKSIIAAYGKALTRSDLSDENLTRLTDAIVDGGLHIEGLLRSAVDTLGDVLIAPTTRFNARVETALGLGYIAAGKPDFIEGVSTFFESVLRGRDSRIDSCMAVINAICHNVEILFKPSIIGLMGDFLCREDLTYEHEGHIIHFFAVFVERKPSSRDDIINTLRLVTRRKPQLENLINDIMNLFLDLDSHQIHQEYLNIPEDMQVEHGLSPDIHKDRFYLGNTEETAITQNDIMGWRSALRAIELSDGIEFDLDIKEERNRFTAVNIEGRGIFVVNNSILRVIPLNTMKIILNQAFESGDINSLSFGSGPIILSLCKRSAHLFGDCLANRVVIMNEAFLKVYEEMKQDNMEEEAQVLLQIGLEHELLHELRKKGAEIEGELRDRDIKRMVHLLGNRALNVIRYLSGKWIIYPDIAIGHIAQKIHENVQPERQDLMLNLVTGSLRSTAGQENVLELELDSDSILGREVEGASLTYWDILKAMLETDNGRMDSSVELIPEGMTVEGIRELLRQVLLRKKLISKDNALSDSNLDKIQNLAGGLSEKKKISISSKLLVDNIKMLGNNRFNYNQQSSGIKYLFRRIQKGFKVEIINESGISDKELQDLVSAIFHFGQYFSTNRMTVVNHEDARAPDRYKDAILLLHKDSDDSLKELRNSGIKVLIGEIGVSINILITVGIYKLLGKDESEMKELLVNLGYTGDQIAQMNLEDLFTLPPVTSMLNLTNDIASFGRTIDMAA